MPPRDDRPELSALTPDLQVIVDAAARRVRATIDRVTVAGAASDGPRHERRLEAALGRRLAGLPPAQRAHLAVRAAPRVALRRVASRERSPIDISQHVARLAEQLHRLTVGPEVTGVGKLLDRACDTKAWRPTSVKLRLKRVVCHNPTRDGSKHDEIKIAAIGHDIYRRRDDQMGPLDLGKFAKSDARPLDLKLASFTLQAGMWSDSLYLATIFLAEADHGGMDEFIAEHGLSSHEMLELITAASGSQVLSLLGVDTGDDEDYEPARMVSALALGIGPLFAVGAAATVGGLPVSATVLAELGVVIGKLLKNVVLQIFLDWISDLYHDENFPPQVVQLHLGVPDGTEKPSGDPIRGEVIFTLTEPGIVSSNVARYEVEFEWDIKYTQGAAFTSPPATEGSGARAVKNLDKIEHIVVVMLENRSFDHMLGFLTADRQRPEFADPFNRQKFCDVAPGTIAGMPALRVSTAHCADTRSDNDPNHDWESVLWQVARLTGEAWPSADEYQKLVETKRTMGGFAEDYLRQLLKFEDLDLASGQPISGARLAKIKAQLGDIMNYHPAEHVPTFDLFATEFAVCDRWFSAFPGNTWVNRTIALTGQPARKGEEFEVENKMPFTMRSFFQVLDEHRYKNRSIDWACYSQDVPSLLMVDTHYAGELAKIGSATPGRLRTIERFFADAEADRLPHVSWIDPNFVDIGDMRDDLTGLDLDLDTDGYPWAHLFATNTANDDHPPTDISHGQSFLLAVFLALFRSKAWDKTMLVVTYDEHGGFHDHVPPPYLAPSIAESPLFRSLGVRVPAMVVSPWVDRKLVSHTQFDHTSIIKTILMKFCRDAQGRIPTISSRVTAANHLGGLLNATTPRFVQSAASSDFMARVSDGVEQLRPAGPA